MKKALSVLFGVALALGVSAQVNVWENPSVTGINKELPRTQLASYATLEQAVDRAATSLYMQALTEEWSSQPVPNATIYRTRYKMPFQWIDREIFVRIPAAPASYEVRVNGEQVGYSQEAKTAAEFDITKRSKEGYNDLEIVVYNDPASRVLENYLHPITTAPPAGVCVVAQPKVRIRDIVVEASYENNGGLLNAGVVIKSHLLNEKRVRLYYELLTPDGKTLSTGYRDAAFEMRGEDTIRFFSRLGNIRPWSHTNPVLYTLLLKLQQEGRYTEYMSARVGFRSVGVDGTSLTINGEPLAVKMADFTPGGDLPGDEARIAELKRQGVNTLRLLPYPQSEAFYAMCDRVGIYLCDQADVDTHQAGDSRLRGGNPSNDPKWREAYVDRAVGMYHTSKIHPSVVLYSTASQSSNGINLYDSYMALKALDPSRPVIYPEAGGEWNSDATLAANGTLVMRTSDYRPEVPLLADAGSPVRAGATPGDGGVTPPPAAPAPATPAVAAQPAQPAQPPKPAPSPIPATQPAPAQPAAAQPAPAAPQPAKPAPPAAAVKPAETAQPAIPVQLNVDDARIGRFSLTNLYGSLPLTRVEVIYTVISGRREMSHGSLFVDVDPRQTTPFKVPLGDYIIGGKFDIMLEITVLRDQLTPGFTPQPHIDQTKKDKDRRRKTDDGPRVTVDALEFSISL